MVNHVKLAWSTTMTGRPIFLFLALLAIGQFFSCDLLLNSDSETTRHDTTKLITYTIDSDSGWKDRIIIYNGGRAAFERVQGENIPHAERILSDDELSYIKALLGTISDLEENYTGEQSYTTYTIEYYGPEGTKKIVCDNTVFSHSVLDDPDFVKLRNIVIELNTVRTSLIGETALTDVLEFNLKPQNTTVTLDESVVLEYSVTNKTAEAIVLPFANQQQLGFRVYRENELLITFPEIYQPATSGWMIPRNSTVQQQITWDHFVRDDTGSEALKAKAGTYTIVQHLLDGNSPFQSTKVTITEEGDERIQSAVTRGFGTPITFTYVLNNRVSESFVFSFDSDARVGFEVHTRETGEIVFADTVYTDAPGTLLLDAFDVQSFAYSWDRRGENGERVPAGSYTVKMWLVDQDNDHRAEIHFYNTSL
jgi:hypothetical protein